MISNGKCTNFRSEPLIPTIENEPCEALNLAYRRLADKVNELVRTLNSEPWKQ